MRDKGFTLIELLAVIVILAIISLIAVPIVINIINDSKNSSDEQSVELYLDTVEKTITKKQLKDPNFNPDKCEIKDKGDLECYKDNKKIAVLKIEMKGKMPNKGKITILNNKFNYKNIWFNNKKYYVIATLLSDTDNNNEISIGDKYSYKVNDTDTFNFYVLTEPEDDKVNLIMDRNICEDGTPATLDNICSSEWHGQHHSYNDDDNSYGPDTAMLGIYNATKNWNNVSDMDLSEEKAYLDEGHIVDSNYGYGKIETTETGIKITKKDGTTEVTRGDNQTPVIPYETNKSLKARLPKQSEVTSTEAGCTTSDLGSCPTWLVENLDLDDAFSWCSMCKTKYTGISKISNISGYWLLSSFPGDIYKSYLISYQGRPASADTSRSGGIGIRPVITVPISDLE